MQQKIKRIYIPKIRTFVVMTICAVLLLFATKMALWSMRLMNDTGLTPITVARLALDTGTPLKSSNGRTNLLILGIGGGTHPGADLTDTMLVVSLDVGKRTMAMISIPRDIWSETLQDKVNSAYHYGEEKKNGGGLVLAKVIAEEISGLSIQYSMVVDFSGFRRVIDLLGGVRVRVTAAFTDPSFPIEGKETDECGGDPLLACRYQSIHFDAGEQLMDGARALLYVRSRHAEGEEGSDFARSRRQQDVLLAMKETVLTPRLLFSPRQIWNLVRAVDEATETDMTIGETLTIGKMLLRISDANIQKISIEDLLWSPPTSWYGRYVLVPKESWEEVQKFLQSQLD